MGGAIASGLIESGLSPERIFATCRRPERAAEIQETLEVNAGHDNALALRQAEYVVLAVGHDDGPETLKSLLPHLDPQRHLLVSVVYGFWPEEIESILGDQRLPCFVAVPNINVSMGCKRGGALPTTSAAWNTDNDRARYENYFSPLGSILYMTIEELIAQSLILASGPALMMRAVAGASGGAAQHGVAWNKAVELSARAMIAAGHLLLEYGDPHVVETKVASPGGRTIEALPEVIGGGVEQAYWQAFHKLLA